MVECKMLFLFSLRNKELTLLTLFELEFHIMISALHAD